MGDDVTFVALTVSLVALLMGVWQLLQANFRTAEGLQQTNLAVMGNWANMTRWRWNWIEFRFVIKYITPHIVIGATDELDEDEVYSKVDAEGEGESGLWALAENIEGGSSSSDGMLMGFRKSVRNVRIALAAHLDPRVWKWRKDRWRLQKLHVLGYNTLPEDIEGTWKRPYGRLGGFQKIVRTVWMALAHLNPQEVDSELMVSWDRLLQVAHNYQWSIFQLRRDHSPNVSPGAESLQTEKGNRKSSGDDGNYRSVAPSMVYVKLRRRNWDYGMSLPPCSSSCANIDLCSKSS